MRPSRIIIGTAAVGGLTIPVAAYHRRQFNRQNMNILKQSTAVDVLIGPFVDSTDGDTEETALTIAAADVLLSKNGQALTLKSDVTACAHDANGMYNCELDATDTDTVGSIVLFVHVSGALAVRHEFQVVEEAVYADLYASAAAGYAGVTELATVDSNVDLILVDTTEIGVAGAGLTNINLPNQTMDITGNLSGSVGSVTGAVGSVTGAVGSVSAQVSADVTAVSGDTTAADNLELMFDGTGYVDETAPSSRAQVGAISSGSAAISTTAASATVTTGTETLTYTATAQLDGSLHEVADVANSTEFYYQFSVGGNGIPVEFLWDGYAQSNGDSYAVKAYNWGNTSWDQIGSIVAANGTTIVSEAFQATNAHVGTGANIGVVRLQFTSSDGTHFATDRVLCSYAVVAQSVGYDGGQVWINTVSGVAGVEPYINGVADNQALTLANAITLSAAIPLNRFFASNDSTITFAESHVDETWSGEGWTCALGGQDISNTHFHHCNDISGIGTAPTGEAHILDSHIGAITLGESHITRCSFKSTFTAGAAGDYTIENSKSGVAGSGSPTLTFTGLGSATTINARGWMGGGIWVFDSDCMASVEVLIGGTHTVTTGGGDIEFRGTPKDLSVVTSGTGTTNIIVWSGCPVSISGTGGTVNIYGMHNGITDTSSGTTVTDLGVDVTKVDDILVDTAEIGTAGAGLTDLGGMSTAMKAEVNTEADTALTDYDPPTNTQMEARTPTAAQLAYITANSATGLPVTFTTAGGSTTAAVLALVDGSAGSATNDQYNGRLLVFTDGTLKGVVTDITDYVGSTTTATITAIPTAPLDTHNARLI